MMTELTRLIIIGRKDRSWGSISGPCCLTSAAFRALLIATDEAERQAATFALCSLAGHVRELFEMGGLRDRVLDSRFARGSARSGSARQGHAATNLDIPIRYAGAPLNIPEQRPTLREIVASEEGERLLAGYLLRQSADRIQARASGESTEMLLHYDH